MENVWQHTKNPLPNPPRKGEGAKPVSWWGGPLALIKTAK